MRLKNPIALTAVAMTALLLGVALEQSVFAQQPDAAQIQKMREEALERAKRQGEERKREQDAFWARAMPQVLAPAPASPWLEAEKRFYADLVALASAKVIVVPPTIPEGEPGIDLTSRITIARLLAAQIEADAGPIPDPGLVYRAFGEARTLTHASVREQLNRSSAQWFIVGTVRRSGDRLQVSFTQIPARAPGPTEPVPAFKIDNLEIGAEPPELRVAHYIPDAAAALGYPSSPARAAITKPNPLALPESLAGSFPVDASTLGGVWMQQMLGVLQVPYFDTSSRPQERVFERTLAALIALPKAAPDRAVLLARALAYLDRREAALRALAEAPETPEKKALAAYLAADLPALQAALANVTRPAAQLISQLELLRLRVAFRTISDGELRGTAQKLAGSTPAAWQTLVAMHVLGASLWTLPSSVSLKPLLDKEFPVAGYGLEDIARGKAALGARAVDEKLEAELLLSPISHAARWRRANMKELCCRGSGVHMMEADRSQVLDLVEADAERLALARLEFLGRVQGLPQRMRRQADLYDEVLFNGGHPGVAQQRMEGSFAEGFRTAERARLWTEAFENSRKVLSWEPGQGLPTANALTVRRATYASYLGSNFARELPPHALELDIPMRSAFAARADGFASMSRADFAASASRDSCVNTVPNFQLCEDYAKRLKESARRANLDAEVAALIVPRFAGSAQRLELLASIAVDKGQVEAARKLLQQAAALPYASESAFKALAQLLQGEGDLAAAGAAYARFLALKTTSEEGRVAISNYASSAGYALARIGAIKEARPLLERAAGNADGSYASLWSASELALLDGDYPRSLEIFRETYQRYGQPASVRAIASLLFATGEPVAAWSALGEMPSGSREFAPQRAVPVGLRMSGTEPAALLEWYGGVMQKLRASGQQFQDPAFIHNSLLQTVLIDREAGAYDDLFDTILDEMLARFRPGAPVIPKAERKFAPPDPMGPTAGPFRSAYDAFRRGDHAGAIEAWSKLVRDFDSIAFPPRFADQNGETFWSGMPYFAISLVKSGRAAEAANLSVRLTREGRPAGSKPVSERMEQVPMPDFDRKMIAAIVAAYAGDHPKAQLLLRGARGSMAEPGSRLIPPEYAYAEILELLAQDTKQRAYLTMAVEFAQAFRRYEPWAAWAYAFEAAHASGADQLHAATLALKLDRNSMRLKRVDARVLERAREELARNDPFLVKPPAGRRSAKPSA